MKKEKEKARGYADGKGGNKYSVSVCKWELMRGCSYFFFQREIFYFFMRKKMYWLQFLLYVSKEIVRIEVSIDLC